MTQRDQARASPPRRRRRRGCRLSGLRGELIECQSCPRRSNFGDTRRNTGCARWRLQCTQYFEIKKLKVLFERSPAARVKITQLDWSYLSCLRLY